MKQGSFRNSHKQSKRAIRQLLGPPHPALPPPPNGPCFHRQPRASLLLLRLIRPFSSCSPGVDSALLHCMLRPSNLAHSQTNPPIPDLFTVLPLSRPPVPQPKSRRQDSFLT
ncbi:hypothetical protein Mapa_009717 [Marchantia paleacea]|nr:hypothetical protein Mapa_009717 [Marchantia paleacea]